MPSPFLKIMNRLIFPDIIKNHVTAFFTQKDTGADLDYISKIFKIRKDNIYMPIQKHTGRIVFIEPSFKRKIADAALTKEKGILLGVQVADCVPILMYEIKEGVSGVVHAGWRGTSEAILKKTILAIKEKYSGRPENIMIAIGPSIRGCCYEVDHDVLSAVRQATGEGEYFSEKSHKYCLDLAAANKYQALSMKIPESNIWISDECTFCSNEKFYSYRYARGPTGRQGGFIGRI